MVTALSCWFNDFWSAPHYVGRSGSENLDLEICFHVYDITFRVTKLFSDSIFNDKKENIENALPLIYYEKMVNLLLLSIFLIYIHGTLQW